ncbi:hypothetical protein M758_6G017100 [Ceratodon purpureus]|nr:hypothetical protein M758_6G017100 [Ceratodon purpureus]
MNCIIQKFAKRYCEDNPNVFKNENNACLLTYDVIRLNANLHNSKNWKKMTKFEFLNKLSFQTMEENIPREQLEEIYDSIVLEKIKLKGDDSKIPNDSFFDKLRSWWISKKWCFNVV